MSNEYQVRAVGRAVAIGQGRRLQIQGAVLGGGIPLLLATVSYWTPGWAGVADLMLLGAVVGSILGWRNAEQAVVTTTPIEMAGISGVKGALAGASAFAIYFFAYMTFTSFNVGGALLVAGLTVVIGLVVGSFLSIPVALVSVFLLRRFGATGQTATTLAAILLVAILLIGGAVVIDFPQNGSQRLYPDHDPQGQVATWDIAA